MFVSCVQSTRDPQRESRQDVNEDVDWSGISSDRIGNSSTSTSGNDAEQSRSQRCSTPILRRQSNLAIKQYSMMFWRENNEFNVFIDLYTTLGWLTIAVIQQWAEFRLSSST